METMARHSYERTQPGLYNQRVIPEVPRLRARRTGRLHRPPLVV